MCIRDSLNDTLRERFYEELKSAKRTEGKMARAEAVGKVKEQAVAALIPDPKADGAIEMNAFGSASVSYTHLTLPTGDLV